MKTIKQFMVVAVIGTLGAVPCALADDPVATSAMADSPAGSFYRANELSFDLFGSGSIGRETIDNISGDRVRRHGRLGAGAGVNYFFTRYLGVGADAYTENTSHAFVDSTSGNLIARMPIAETGVAPYIFGGGGYQFDAVEQKFAQAGAGVEFRFTQHIGLFVDARYVFADKTDDYGVGRGGLRISF